MTDYAALKTEILKPAYNGMTDQQIADAINVLMVVVNRDVVSQDAINALIFTTNGDWANVVGVADGVVTAGVSVANRLRCISVKELFTRNAVFQSSNDTKWSRFIAVVDALIADNTRMSEEGKTTITALARPSVKFTDLYGWPFGVSAGEIAVARNY